MSVTLSTNQQKHLTHLPTPQLPKGTFTDLSMPPTTQWLLFSSGITFALPHREQCDYLAVFPLTVTLSAFLHLLIPLQQVNESSPSFCLFILQDYLCLSSLLQALSDFLALMLFGNLWCFVAQCGKLKSP